MCILCKDNNLDYSITELCISYCKNVKKIPKELTQLTRLSCYHTNITEIPRELTQLKYLNCTNTNITEIPQEFTQLSLVNCGNTNITEIPRELTQLTYLHCNHTKITEIPRELTQLTSLGCYDCPNLVKIPLRFKERHVNDDNFLRVPTKSRIIFLQYKKGYLESVRFNMEIKFNEVYWAPGGQGALELFEKYKLN